MGATQQTSLCAIPPVLLRTSYQDGQPALPQPSPRLSQAFLLSVQVAFLPIFPPYPRPISAISAITRAASPPPSDSAPQEGLLARELYPFPSLLLRPGLLPFYRSFLVFQSHCSALSHRRRRMQQKPHPLSPRQPSAPSSISPAGQAALPASSPFCIPSSLITPPPALTLSPSAHPCAQTPPGLTLSDPSQTNKRNQMS